MQILTTYLMESEGVQVSKVSKKWRNDLAQGEVLTRLSMLAFEGMNSVQDAVNDGVAVDPNALPDPESVVYTGMWTEDDSLYWHYYTFMLAGEVLRCESTHRDPRAKGHSEMTSRYVDLQELLSDVPSRFGVGLLSKVWEHTHLMFMPNDRDDARQRQVAIIGSVVKKVQSETGVPPAQQ